MKEERYLEISELISSRELSAARTELAPLSAEGDAQANYLLAGLYFLDDPDSTEAEVIECLSRAIQEEYAPALYLRATINVAPDSTLTIDDPQGPSERKLLVRAAELGYAPAQLVLADYLGDGDAGFRKNLKEARYWYQEACEQGYVSAYVEYASMLLEGEGGKQEVGPGVGWLQKGVIERDEECAGYLADIYREGMYGIEPDPDLAAEYNSLADEFFSENLDLDGLPPEVFEFLESISHLPEDEQKTAIREFLTELVGTFDAEEEAEKD